MASSVIGALRVNLGLDTAQFDKGLKDVSSQLGKIGALLNKGIVAAGVGIAAAAGAITVALKSTINEADDLGKTAQKIGIPVEELSKLKYAAELADVSMEALSTAVGKLSKNMADVAGGAINDASKTFAALGISVKNSDGTLKSSSQVLTEISSKFAGMEDGAGKTAIAMTLLGKSGKELIPLLNEGASGLEAMMREAEQLGIVIDGKTAKAAEGFNDNLTRLHAAFNGLIVQVASALLPQLVDLTDRFVEMVKNGNLVSKTMDVMNFAFKQGALFGAHLNAILEEFSRWWQFIQEAGNAGSFSEFTAAFQRAADDVLKIQENLKAKIDAIQQEMGSNVGAKADRLDIKSTEPAKVPAPIVPTGTVPKIKAVQTSMTELGEEGRKVWEETRLPMEAFGTEVARLGILMKAGVIDADTYNRAIVGLKEQFGIAGLKIADVGAVVGNSLSSVFDGLIEGTFDAIDALKDLASNLAKLALNSVFKQLSQQQGGASGGFLGGLFNSLAGFASGGSFRVGGAGGIDSQLVAFKASPNETVSIHRPGQDAGGGGSVINNIITPPGAKAETSSRESGGLKINDIVITIVDKHLASDRGSKTMSAIYGLSRRTTRR